ncbi:hypothetical protein [Microbacterium halophytorum]|uniref:hypothetical protein n=1 Tax=Microbacterium halophytorum TaxID=2067568 RepID=UPI000CFC8209|nr:hypothetical protein [Microbacterium halophytorum]
MTNGGGYAAPYSAPVDPRFASIADPQRKRRTAAAARIALVLAIGALAIAAVPLWFAGRASGAAVGASGVLDAGVWSWAVLAPARSAVIAAEVGFWLGTVLGLWALVQGIVAARRPVGRTAAVWAIVVAAAAPLLLTALTFGAVASAIGAPADGVAPDTALLALSPAPPR